MTETEPTPSKIAFQKLSASDDRSQFDCGNLELNEYLKKYARQNQDLSLGITYTAKREHEQTILGFYTLSSGQILFQDVPKELTKRLPRYPLPIARIGRLARDLSTKGTGMGELLLMDAFQRVLNVSEAMGIYGIEVVAKDAGAKRFYERYGFQELLDDPLHLFLSLKAIRNAFVSP
ncbi:GNAT family N-acetyltransferase [Myxococcota bacterium]|nr:GNAT family N-acetyltransferase [Myxococcota bacterium]